VKTEQIKLQTTYVTYSQNTLRCSEIPSRAYTYRYSYACQKGSIFVSRQTIYCNVKLRRVRTTIVAAENK